MEHMHLWWLLLLFALPALSQAAHDPYLLVTISHPASVSRVVPLDINDTALNSAGLSGAACALVGNGSWRAAHCIAARARA
jgi:hypothetical protein